MELTLLHYLLVAESIIKINKEELVNYVFSSSLELLFYGPAQCGTLYNAFMYVKFK